MLGGSNGGPQGTSGRIHGPLPQVRWDVGRKGAFGSFERVLLVLTLLESGLGQRAHFSGKYCYLGALMGVPRVPDGRCIDPCHGRWGERRKAAFGSFQRVLLVLTLLESGLRQRAPFGGKYCPLGAPMGVPRVPDGQYMAPCHR